MMRAKECASGRKRSVEGLGISKSCGSAPWTALRTVEIMFACVSSQPFGRPVVPEV
jgi:hypothetical protein